MVTVFRGGSVTNRLNIKHLLQVLMGAIVNRGPYSLDITLSLFRVVISQNWTVNSFGVELSMPSSLFLSRFSSLSNDINNNMDICPPHSFKGLFFSVLFIILFYFNIAFGTRFVSLVRAVETAIQKVRRQRPSSSSSSPKEISVRWVEKE